MKPVAEVQYVEVMTDQVYIEYTDGDSCYVSFTKAKTLIGNSTKELIGYSIVDSQKALLFINSVPRRTRITKDGKSFLRAKT